MKRPLPTPPFVEHLRRIQRTSLLVGAVGTALCLLGYLLSPVEFFQAYLVGYLYWFSIAIGCLVIAMLNHVTGGGWGIPIRRILEAAYGTLPLLAILFLPIAMGMKSLYLWARPDIVETDVLLQETSLYLNGPAFEVRTAAYFALWVLLAMFLNRFSLRADRKPRGHDRRRLRLLSGPGLVIYGLTITFASVDWAMSLEPHWFSSMYGVLFMAGEAVSGMAFALFAAIGLAAFEPWRSELTHDRRHDLGNLLLAFVLFWTYISLMQFLIIWSGNLPEETPWYLNRSVGGWQWVAWVLTAFHFVIPFFLLLSKQNKRDLHSLGFVVSLLLAMRLVELYWLVTPAFSPKAMWLHWLHLVTPMTIGGLWVALFAATLISRGQVPVSEVLEEEADA